MPPRNSASPPRSEARVSGQRPPFRLRQPPRQGQPAARRQPTRRGITMLGAQQTGKTTFLAALQIALLRQRDLGWSLTGDNDGSTQALVSFMDEMTHEHRFPQPTGEQLEEYRWSLETVMRRSEKEWHWWGFRRLDKYIKIPLNLVDAPGEAANGSRMYNIRRAISANLVENMARSAGIVLFFDPLSEIQRGDAFRHTHGVLTQLKSQAAENGKLPHYLAVCVTKFDEIPVLKTAQAMRAIEFDVDEPTFPRVPEEDAQEFFERLIRLSKADNATLIMPLIKQLFHEDRVRFFVTSAIGFYVGTSRVFNPDDYQNHIPGDIQRGDPGRIRGGIYPINVVEPVLWLGSNMARVAG